MASALSKRGSDELPAARHVRARRPRVRPSPAGLAFAGLLLAGCTGGSAPPALDRGTVHVAIAETLDGVPTDLNIAQLLVTRALLQHGYHLAPAAEARVLVEGRLTCTYHQDLTMNIGGVEQHLEHQWHARFAVTVTDRGPQGGAASGAGSGDAGGEPYPRTESFAFPEPLMQGRIDPEDARRDIRRRAATVMIHDIVRGRILGDPEVAQLLDALQDPFDPRRFEEIEAEVVALGPRAVPFLIAALADERPVRPIGAYPGLDEHNIEELKVCHLADRMLSDILWREAGLDLLSTEERRLRVIQGWTWAWEDVQRIPLEYRVEPEKRPGKDQGAERGG